MRAERIRSLGFQGDDLYLQRLGYAQFLLSQKKPAQALLQINKAFHLKQISDATLLDYPWPYAAVAWIMRFATDDGFTGNPVRHFQHYATRMSGDHAELRTWRAWACFYLAYKILEESDFPRDEQQICEEGLVIPSQDVVSNKLPKEETVIWQAAFNKWAEIKKPHREG